MTSCVKPKQRFWTNQDVAYLKQHFGVISTKVIAAKLQRSVNAIHHKAKSIGITLKSRKTELRAGGNPEANPEIAFCHSLLAYPIQSKLKWGSWSAFDMLRMLICFGILDDALVAKAIGRHAPSLNSQRRLYHWTMHQAQCLREKLVMQPMLQNKLITLAGTSEVIIPTEILDIVKDAPDR